MSDELDLLVIGGGPAGTTLAALASRAGARVTLVERAAFPRDKVCGEFVSAEGVSVLERLGLLDGLHAAGAVSMQRCRVSDGRGRHFDAELPRIPGIGRSALGISRALLDERLMACAAAAGATIRCRIEGTGPIVEDGRVRGYRLRAVGGGSREERVRARLVIAADGRRSHLARRLHPQLCDPRRTGKRSWFGLKTHLASDASRRPEGVELHLFDGGYAGVAAVEDSRINLCLLTTVAALRACGGRPDRLIAERVSANPAAAERIGGLPRASSWHSIGPLRWGVRRASSAGALFVGDAAGTVDPFSGEGISNALRGAEIALPHTLAALERGGLDDAAAAAYQREWSRHFAPMTRRVRAIGGVLERPRIAGVVIGFLGGIGASWAPRLVAATRTGAGG